MTITRAEVSATDSLGVPAARAFHGLHAAYEAIGVPVTPRPGETSSIRTTLAARAFNMSGSSGNPQTCSSTGVLEALVNARANTLASAR